MCSSSFQPTRPLRGATVLAVIEGYQPSQISTHAPLAGRDMRLKRECQKRFISTHAPLAGRDVELLPLTTSKEEFQPTRPLRGATLRFVLVTSSFSYFNPRAPCGARRFLSLPNFLVPKFQPTRPLRGATAWSAGQAQIQRISTHAPLAGRDSKSVQITMHIFAITDKFQMFLRKMPTVRAFCFFFVREKRANFSANRPDNFCALVLRTIRASVPRADTSACSRSVRFYSRTSCPSSKIEGCPFLGQ